MHLIAITTKRHARDEYNSDSASKLEKIPLGRYMMRNLRNSL